MITKWKLSNFKSVRHESELDMAPLTIFAGPNSSGKSTLLQSMLLISQTLSSKIPSRSVVLNGQLARLGQFDDLRSYESNQEEISIAWECKPLPAELPATPAVALPRAVPFWHGAYGMETVACQISFDVGSASSQREFLQLHPRLRTCRLECRSKGRGDNEPSDQITGISISRERPPSDRASDLTPARAPKLDGADELDPASLEYQVQLDAEFVRELHEEIPSALIVGCDFRHFLPSNLIIRFDQVEQEARLLLSVLTLEGPRPTRVASRLTYLRNASVPEQVISLLLDRLGDTVRPIVYQRSLSGPDSGDTEPQIGPLFGPEAIPTITLREWQERMRRSMPVRRNDLRRALQNIAQEILAVAKGGKGKEYAVSDYNLPDEIDAAVNYLDTYFSTAVKYLGPLRDDPKPLYPLATTVDPFDVGLRGENTAAVLDLHKTRMIRYIPPPESTRHGLRQQAVTCKLAVAVLNWLRYLGIAEGIETHDRGKTGHELKIVTSLVNKQNDLTHVGVGVSQVLPILVMCLLADRDTTLILEQPELHLHPRVQTLLADFFLSMATLGKQCVIETHSEYIINRLRLRTVAADGDSVLSLIKLYFVEPKNGESSIREVAVNRYGAIVEWPEGFFDQSQYEAEEILRAAGIKRERDRRSQKNE